MSSVEIEISEYDAGWPGMFSEYGSEIRSATGGLALRIDHIGSTAVPGLAAKPIVDIQLVLEDWSPFDPLLPALEAIGYQFYPDNPDGRKRYFTLENDGNRLVNVHVRLFAEFSAQAALLFRDYLRVEASARRRYEETKRRLASQIWDSVDDYADAKGDIIWVLLREADVWAWSSRWSPGETDA